MIKEDKKETELLHFIQNLKTIRLQSLRMLSLARQNKLRHFIVNETRMPAAVNYVLEVIKSQYPSLDIPYHSRWRHFEVGGIDRVAELLGKPSVFSLQELGKILFELAIFSVLLDAGAGKFWQYRELDSGLIFSRSEGLAVASLALYKSGKLSKLTKEPFRIDAQCLLSFNQDQLRQALQVTETNPLEGLPGRVNLLNKLGQVLRAHPQYFGEEGRLGNLFSYLFGLQSQGRLAATEIFQTLLKAFQEIWPERQSYQGLSLGDVWLYPKLRLADQLGSELVPFHKLSQWLTYSLIEPLEQVGIEVSGLEELTGLAEYRNGGLLIDIGLLEVKDKEVLKIRQSADSDAIIEWRALTIALLDELAASIRRQLRVNERELPLAKILQGGTWEAGRRLARQKRPDGVPPLEIISDGTVF